MQRNTAGRAGGLRHQGQLGQPLAHLRGPQLIQPGGRPPQPGDQAERDGLILGEHAQLSEPLRILAVQQAGTGPDRGPHRLRPLVGLAHIQPPRPVTAKLIDYCRAARAPAAPAAPPPARTRPCIAATCA